MIDIWGNMIFDRASRGISEFWWPRKLPIVVRRAWCVETAPYDGVAMVLISVQSFQDHSAALFWLFLQAWVMAMGSVWQCEAAPCWVVRNWTFLKLECRLMNECAQSVVCLLLAVWIVSSLLKINRTLWEGGFG
uniref:Uncharacterized protein n=1 Tax=Physcomitrium patens TaxID=3218 RepID=A0A2K1KMJ4_PHYPA|nr:hypothetical protein PHYPA_005884 [Physcomitrium patens]